MKVHEDPLDSAEAIREEADGSLTRAQRLRRAAELRFRAAAASAVVAKAERDVNRFGEAARVYVERAAALEEDDG